MMIRKATLALLALMIVCQATSASAFFMPRGGALGKAKVSKGKVGKVVAAK